jgi:hypothetical protein
MALLAGATCSGSSDRGSAGDGSPRPSGPRAVIEAPGGSTAPPTVSTTVASRFEFVDYQTAGGITGTNKGLKVWPDGRAACTKETQRVDFSVPAATVTELRRALEAADLAALPPNNGIQTPDATVSRVIFGGQAVRFVTGSMPPALGPAVTILDRLLARGCP